MKDEIKVNKANKSITFINNGIAFSQFGVADEILDLITNLQEENENLKYKINAIETFIKMKNGELPIHSHYDNTKDFSVYDPYKKIMDIINKEMSYYYDWNEGDDKE